jgi:hypothetical protein
MKKILLVLFLYYPIYAYTQGWSFEYSVGYGTYQLDDIKAMQDLILKSNNYGLKETDHFPGYITHTCALGFAIGSHHFGSNISYLTTGGRLRKADYSGSYTIDMVMNGYRLGTFYRYYIHTGFSPLHIYLQISPGVLLSNLKMEEKVNIYSESAKESNTLKGAGIYIEPTIGITYRLTDWLRFSFGGGYEADFLGTLKLSGQKTQTKAHWNGLRLYGGLLFILPDRNFSSR